MKEPMVRVKNKLGVLDLLQVGLILLKVADMINWSWWQVFMPLIVIAIVSAVTSVIKGITGEKSEEEIDEEDIASKVVISIPYKRDIDWKAIHAAIEDAEEKMGKGKESK